MAGINLNKSKHDFTGLAVTPAPDVRLDILYKNNYKNEEIITEALTQKRIILTPARSEALALFGQKGTFCKGLGRSFHGQGKYKHTGT